MRLRAMASVLRKWVLALALAILCQITAFTDEWTADTSRNDLIFGSGEYYNPKVILIRITNNIAKFMVIAEKDNGTDLDIVGRIVHVTMDSNQINASDEYGSREFDICAQAGDQHSFEYVFDGTDTTNPYVFLAWVDERGNDKDIYATRLDSTGSIDISNSWDQAGNPVCAASGEQTNPSVTFNINLGVSYFVAWEDQRNGDKDIYSQKLTPNGSVEFDEDGAAVCTISGDQSNPEIAAEEDNSYVVWEDNRSEQASRIFCAKLNSSGGPVSNPSQGWRWQKNGYSVSENANLSDIETDPFITIYTTPGSFSAKSIVVMWLSSDDSNSISRIRFVRLNLTTGIRVKETSNIVDVASYDGSKGEGSIDSYTAIKGFSSGEIIFAFEVNKGLPSGSDIHVIKVFDSGATYFSDKKVSASGANTAPSITEQGSFIFISWINSDTTGEATSNAMLHCIDNSNGTDHSSWPAGGTEISGSDAARGEPSIASARIAIPTAYVRTLCVWEDTRGDSSSGGGNPDPSGGGSGDPDPSGGGGGGFGIGDGESGAESNEVYGQLVDDDYLFGSEPNSVVNMTLTALSSTRVRIDFDDNSAIEDGFKLFRKQSSSGMFSTPTYTEIYDFPSAAGTGNAITYTDTGLTPEQAYDYKVIAYNGTGDSIGNKSSVTTLEDTPPLAPSALTGSINDISITLTWIDNSDNEDGFRVEKSGGEDESFNKISDLPKNSTSFDSVLDPLTEQERFRVVAYNSLGTAASNTLVIVNGGIVDSEEASASSTPEDDTPDKPFVSFGSDKTALGAHCYIATTSYTGYIAPEVRQLGSFRDVIMCRLSTGETSLKLYRTLAPVTSLAASGIKTYTRGALNTLTKVTSGITVVATLCAILLLLFRNPGKF